MKKGLFFVLLTIIIGGFVITNFTKKTTTATFAGGCFWCMEPPFEKINGVIDVTSGYIGGTGENPTYQDYADKNFVEAIQITYDPNKISYEQLLNVFWQQIDPTDAEGQFVDRGKQYRSAIFYHTDEQKKLAESSKEKLEQAKRFEKPIVTQIIPAAKFYKAEDYHQDYYKTHPLKYKFYRWNSGRDTFLQKHWKDNPAISLQQTANNPQYTKPSDAQLRTKLTALQYNVTQRGFTEPPFKNEYWDNTEPGIYVDRISGEPLFNSKDKFKSGTGWPSFTKPLEPDNVVEQKKGFLSFLSGGQEVRSKYSNSHLGDVFKDGPPPTGLRYCINSAALRFIPVKDLEKEGYGKYKALFE